MTIKMWASLPLKVERFDRMEAIFLPLPALRQKTLWNCQEVIFIKFITLLIVFNQLYLSIFIV